MNPLCLEVGVLMPGEIPVASSRSVAGCHLALVIPDLLLQGRVLKKAAWIQEFKGDGHIYSTVPEAKAEMNAL